MNTATKKEPLTSDQLNLIEGIKLIAEFDGWKNDLSDWIKPSDWLEKYIDWSKRSYQYKDLEGKITDGLLKMKYHTSWEWLMAIVEKIEAIKPSELGVFSVDIKHTECIIKDYSRTDKTISYAETQNKKVAVFYAIVDFLKWYNEQKLKK